jgi:hypothetical protein
MLAAASVPMALMPSLDDVCQRRELLVGVLLALGESFDCLCQFDILFREFLDRRFRAIHAVVHHPIVRQLKPRSALLSSPPDIS